MGKFNKPQVVISKCLEHGYCRYDGSQINDPIVNKLKNYFDFVPLCPEMDIGLPSPRQALRIILDGEKEELVFSKTGESVSLSMENYIKVQVEFLKSKDLDGFILKSRSPSCGIKDVKLYKSFGKSPTVPRKTQGFFGKAIINNFQDLAIEDEGRLTNYKIREHFYTRLYTHSSLRELKSNLSMSKLIKFHSQNKFLFMAYNPTLQEKMGKLVANHDNKTLDKLFLEYEGLLNKLLSTSPNNMRFINVMLHIFGYFSRYLNSMEKAHFLDALEQYRDHQIPMSTIMVILRSWVMRFENEYLVEQSIFEPFPGELIVVTDSGKGV